MKQSIIAAILAAAFFTGCGSIATLEGAKGQETYSYSNICDLEDERIYVWKDKGYGSLQKDLSEDRRGSDVFFKAPLGTINFAGKETEEGNRARIIWFENGDEARIPTVTGSDALLYVSKTQVPKEFIYERFADDGYSVGISGLVEDKGGHFYIPYAESRDDDYRTYIDPESGAAVLGSFEKIERLYFDQAGDVSVSENTVTKGGTVALEKEKDYVCQFYTGTYFQDFLLKADVRTFTSMERFEGNDYEFLHANCIRLKVPEYFKSGYYLVLGKGLIRYISPEDEKAYLAGGEKEISWNDPIRLYDENGICIYDPESGIGMGDGGITEEELNSGQEEEVPARETGG